MTRREEIWATIMGSLIGCALGFALGLAVAAEPEPLYTDLKLSEEYSVSLFACHIAQRAVKLLEMEERTLHGRSIILVRADRDYDGSQDMALVFDYNEGVQGVFPHYYVYDTDFNGIPDKAYRDVTGNGVCQEMEAVPVGYILEDGKEGNGGRDS